MTIVMGPASKHRPRGHVRGAELRSAMSSEIVPSHLWDRTVAQFDGVCQEQLYTFARANWPGVALDPVLFWRRGELVGGCLVMIQRLPLGLASLAIVRFGPMLAHAAHPAASEIYAGMIDGLVADYAERRGMMLSVLPRASCSAFNAEADHLMGRGFRAGTRLVAPDRYLVNLRLEEEEQRSSFEQKWRYHLRKSEKAGLAFEHGTPDRLPEFAALYERMRDRKRFPDHSAYHTLPALLAMHNERLRPELFFVRHTGDIIAGAVIFKAGERAVYLYGATTDAALPLRAGYFLHWNIIRWLRDNTAAAWYDLGGTDGFQGLHQFKKGMVGDAGVIQPIPPVANYAARSSSRLIGTAALAARDAYNRLSHLRDQWRGALARPDQGTREPDSDA